MTASEGDGKFKADIDQVLAEFDGKKDLLTTFGQKTKLLIEDFLEDAKIRYQSVQVRVSRQLQSEYRRSLAIRIEAQEQIQLDPVSLRAFIEQESLVAEINNALALVVGNRVLEEISDSFVERLSTAAKLVGMASLQDVREALAKNRVATVEFVRRCQQELWPPRAPVAPFSKGACIFQMCIMLFGAQRKTDTRDLYKKLGLNPSFDTVRQAGIATEVVAGLLS